MSRSSDVFFIKDLPKFKQASYNVSVTTFTGFWTFLIKGKENCTKLQLRSVKTIQLNTPVWCMYLTSSFLLGSLFASSSTIFHFFIGSLSLS